MKKLFLIVIIAGAVAAGIYLLDNDTSAPTNKEINQTPEILADSPLNSTYYFEGDEFKFLDGRSEIETSPNSTSKIVTEVFGEPIYGDVDFDGDEDAVLVFVQNSGGSGTFFYVGIALKKDGGYKGLNTVFLGDRIAPKDTQIQNGLVIHNYADRNLDEPFAVSPTIGISKYLLVENEIVKDISASDGLSRPFSGMLVIGHEVRSFKICGDSDASWIKGNSPALQKIISDFAQIMTGNEPYTPAFAILTGQIMPKETDGFGADYENSFFAEAINSIKPGQTCN